MFGGRHFADGFLQELDTRIADAQAPIDKLDREHKELEREAAVKVQHGQKQFHELTSSHQKVEAMNKWLTKYVFLIRGRRLQTDYSPN